MKKILAAILAVLLLMSMATVSIADDAEPVSLEFFVLYPWVTNELPDPEIDIYKKFFDDNFGIDMKLINSADGDTELLSRFTAGNAPDVIQLGGINNLMKYYEQGVLIDDWTPYIDQLPHFLDAMGADQQNFFTRDDKLIGLAVGAGGQQYGWMIRKDWLAKLGLEMPTNLDELYDVLYAFTFNDPDGNGENDTYGLTSAGGGSGIGELINLVYLMGRGDWYVAEDGTVSHPVLDGTYKELAEFIKKCYDGGVLDPNWYTQGWEERKSMLFAGSFGMCWYPPKALLEENYAARQDEEAMNWWTMMPLFDGCAYSAQNFVGDSVLSVSADCAADENKMAKITEIFDAMNPYAEDDSKYLAIVHGVEFDGYNMTRLDGGTKYIWKNTEQFPYIMRSADEGSYIACAVYAQLFRATGFDQVESGGTSPEADAYFLNKMDEHNKLMAYDHESAEAKYLTLDATLTEETSMAWNEFVLNYILGVDDDYDAFVENWKIVGGEELLESVTEQFTEWGFIG